MRQQMIGFVMASLAILASVQALAQTQDAQANNAQTASAPTESSLAVSGKATGEISAARAAYMQADGEHSQGASLAVTLLAQRGPGPLHAPRGRYPRGGYSPMCSQGGSGRGAAIGALIGAGLGLAIGFRINSQTHPKNEVTAPALFGTFGAAFCAVIGGSHGMMRAARPRRELGSEEELASRGKPARTKEVPAPKSSSSQQPAM